VSRFRNELLAGAAALALAVPGLPVPSAAADLAPALQPIASTAAPAPFVQNHGFDANAIIAGLQAAGTKLLDSEVLPDGNQFWAFHLRGFKFLMATHAIDRGERHE
jgi:hypothetical protein